jgi:hypothetical protein
LVHPDTALECERDAIGPSAVDLTEHRGITAPERGVGPAGPSCVPLDGDARRAHRQNIVRPLCSGTSVSVRVKDQPLGLVGMAVHIGAVDHELVAVAHRDDRRTSLL